MSKKNCKAKHGQEDAKRGQYHNYDHLDPLNQTGQIDNYDDCAPSTWVGQLQSEYAPNNCINEFTIQLHILIEAYSQVFFRYYSQKTWRLKLLNPLNVLIFVLK